EKTIHNITELAQQDRFLAALVYIAVFSVIFYLISAKISHVLMRISRFGQQALGIEQPVYKKGNQLLLLEDWVKAFFRQLIRARDALRSKQEERLRETEVLPSTFSYHAQWLHQYERTKQLLQRTTYAGIDCEW
ncbi:MAG: hypothetical protein ABW107_09945, partial [Candidatus Thiodiazotropha sp. 6PLUC5]